MKLSGVVEVVSGGTTEDDLEGSAVLDLVVLRVRGGAARREDDAAFDDD